MFKFKPDVPEKKRKPPCDRTQPPPIIEDSTESEYEEDDAENVHHDAENGDENESSLHQ